jgi:signal transduction histidine kinase
MSNRVSRLIRSRLVWPVAVAFAVMSILTSEIAYRVARTSASQAVEINTARWSIHRLQLAAADVDLSWRGVVMTGDQAFRDRFDTARRSMTKELEALRLRYAVADDRARADFDRLERIYAKRIDEMARVMMARDAGDVPGARTLLDQGVARHLVEDAEPAARELLMREAASLREERDRFFEALAFGRSGVIVMTLAALVGVGAFRHASVRLHRQREEQREALERERERLESTVAQRTAELRALANHLQTAVEDERAALARELHDELGALLTAATLDVARLKSKLPPGAELEARVAHLNAMLNDGIALKRRIIENLRPSALNNLGLVPAIEILVRETRESLGVPIDADLVPVEASPEAALTIYRFVQEALTNVARHAHARHARVSLHARDGPLAAGLPEGERAPSGGSGRSERGRPLAAGPPHGERGGHIYVEVSDDGVGFDPAGIDVGAHGLSGMRFRVESLGGRMRMESRPGETRLTAIIPSTADAMALAA